MIEKIHITTKKQGLHNITSTIRSAVKSMNIKQGLCTLFIKHTSASLIIQENADPSAKQDLETWLNKLVQENDPLYTHILEGSDDMPAHIKASLTNTSLAIPIDNYDLTLGIWQGIYLWEHRHASSVRELVVHCA